MPVTLKDYLEVYTVNLSGLAVSLNLTWVLDLLNLANDFFHDTQYIWKALPLIATFIYTILKTKNEKSKRYHRDSDTGN